MQKTRALSIAISSAAVVLAVLHVAFPSVEIDFVTVVLIVLAVVPWLSPVMKSVELPGGFKIELQDVRAATEKFGATVVAAAAPSAHAKDERPPYGRDADAIATLHALAAETPNLALVGLRIEIERRIRALAELGGLDSSRMPTTALLHQLSSSGIVPSSTASGLQDLIALGNSAAHGAEVTAAAAGWSLDMAPSILGELDKRLSCKICGRPITIDDEVAGDEAGNYYHKDCVRSRPFS